MIFIVPTEQRQANSGGQKMYCSLWERPSFSSVAAPADRTNMDWLSLHTPCNYATLILSAVPNQWTGITVHALATN